jgi:hypothetical protein
MLCVAVSKALLEREVGREATSKEFFPQADAVSSQSLPTFRTLQPGTEIASDEAVGQAGENDATVSS